ncbi:MULTISPECIES: hypothetical protein [unclassified Streptomyces]|uniref:hypothetical protein n=1 Tax=unclassified Streptomyces TaxID=2593676 RepID=UPI002E374A12|nr:hypothetical protein [Streptomyces sp. NBC_01268]
MATPEHAVRIDHTADGVSMRELLASCAAASAVSTPPREPEAADEQESPVRGEAA